MEKRKIARLRILSALIIHNKPSSVQELILNQGCVESMPCMSLKRVPLSRRCGSTAYSHPRISVPRRYRRSCSKSQSEISSWFVSWPTLRIIITHHPAATSCGNSCANSTPVPPGVTSWRAVFQISLPFSRSRAQQLIRRQRTLRHKIDAAASKKDNVRSWLIDRDVNSIA